MKIINFLYKIIKTPYNILYVPYTRLQKATLNYLPPSQNYKVLSNIYKISREENKYILKYNNLICNSLLMKFCLKSKSITCVFLKSFNNRF